MSRRQAKGQEYKFCAFGSMAPFEHFGELVVWAFGDHLEEVSW